MELSLLHRDDIAEGGFAGLREHRLVMSPRVFRNAAEPGTWPGLGRFIYLADARFHAHGETMMHGHREVDVISVMVDGRITHEGSLEHGKSLSANDVQVQRAGAEGFSHNEINPDDEPNRMIQLWMAPPRPGEPAGYRVYAPAPGGVTRVYGGKPDRSDVFDNRTVIDVALLKPGQEMSVDREYIGYVTRGDGRVNGREAVGDGDLFSGPTLLFSALSDVQLLVIYQESLP